ncbi:MAG: YlmH/Sll1252 family protein [Lactococcus hircilactis]
MSHEDIYQHFKADERQFIERCLDWLMQVDDQYSVISTYFLNPREALILKQLIGNRDIQCFSTGELALSELTKIILAPSFYILDVADFDLALLEIQFAHHYNQLSHAQVLGALLHQTGVKRQEIGDIVITDKTVQVFVSRHLIDVFESIDKIARVAVKIKAIELSALTKSNQEATKEVILVETARIDKIIAASFKVSRNLAANMVESKKVKVNYLEIEKRNGVVGSGDLISVRGYGRIRISDFLGETKKGKQRVSVEILKNRK